MKRQSCCGTQNRGGVDSKAVLCLPVQEPIEKDPNKVCEKYKIFRKACAENDKNVNRKTSKISCKVELVIRGN